MTHLLLYENSPDIRALRAARFLADQPGIRVTFCYHENDPQERYKIPPYGKVTWVKLRRNVDEATDELNRQAKRADALLHFASPGSLLGLACRVAKRADIPLIWDPCDLMAFVREFRELTMHERVASKRAATIVLWADCIREPFDKAYGRVGDIHIVQNYPADWCISDMGLKRNVDVVYAGSVSSNPRNHRYFEPWFRKIMEILTPLGRTMDLIPDASTTPYQRITRDHPGFQIRVAVPADQVIANLRAYKVGLSPMQPHPDCPGYWAPNKVYEYLAAGCQVVARDDIEDVELFLPREDTREAYAEAVLAALDEEEHVADVHRFEDVAGGYLDAIKAAGVTIDPPKAKKKKAKVKAK